MSNLLSRLNEIEKRFKERYVGKKYHRLIRWVVENYYEELELPYTAAESLDGNNLKKTRIAVRKFLAEKIAKIYPDDKKKIYEEKRFPKTFVIAKNDNGKTIYDEDGNPRKVESKTFDFTRGYLANLDNWISETVEMQRGFGTNKKTDIGWVDICSALKIINEKDINKLLFSLFEFDGYELHLRNPLEAAAFHTIYHGKNSDSLRILYDEIIDELNIALEKGDSNFEHSGAFATYEVRDSIFNAIVSDSDGGQLLALVRHRPRIFSTIHTSSYRETARLLSDWAKDDIDYIKEKIANKTVTDAERLVMLEAAKCTKRYKMLDLLANMQLEEKDLRNTLKKLISIVDRDGAIKNSTCAITNFLNKALPHPLFDKEKSISRNVFIYLVLSIIDESIIDEKEKRRDILDIIDDKLEHVGMSPLVDTSTTTCPAFDWLIQEIVLSESDKYIPIDIINDFLLGEVELNDED